MESPNHRARKSVHFDSSAVASSSPTPRADGAGTSSAPTHGDDVSMAGGGSPTTLTPQAAAAPFQLTKDDVYTAFRFFDTAGTGVLHTGNLKPRLSPFFPDMTMKEYRFLLEEPSVGGSSDQGTSRGTGADDLATHGLTAAQLWDLIDTFQRLYLNPAMMEHRQLASTGSGSPSTSPRGGGGSGRRGAPAGAPSPRANSSPSHSPNKHVNKASPRAANSTKAANSSAFVPNTGGLRSASTALPPSIMFDVLHGYGPVREAFEVYDPGHTGAVEVHVLGQIMARIGFGELSQEELTLLVRTADFDRDGRISLSDFRRLVNMKERFKKKKPANTH